VVDFQYGRAHCAAQLGDSRSAIRGEHVGKRQRSVSGLLRGRCHSRATDSPRGHGPARFDRAPDHTGFRRRARVRLCVCRASRVRTVGVPAGLTMVPRISGSAAPSTPRRQRRAEHNQPHVGGWHNEFRPLRALLPTTGRGGAVGHFEAQHVGRAARARLTVQKWLA
jgi:hypothetical protein